MPLHRPRTVVLTIAYDGTNFAGWQRQKNSRSVQATLEVALRKLLGQSIPVVGAGRTDSGVHAKGQVAHAEIPNGMPLPTLKRALNATLPKDLAICSIRKAPDRFHARYAAQGKWYRYVIWNTPDRPLFERSFLHHLPVKLSVAKMQKTARLLQGRHNFKAFHSSGRSVTSTVRTLKRFSVRKQGKKIVIDAIADGFLYHMVRRMVGLLIEVGKGKVEPAQVRQLLQPGRTNGKPFIPPTAPAKGLCLMKVRY